MGSRWYRPSASFFCLSPYLPYFKTCKREEPWLILLNHGSSHSMQCGSGNGHARDLSANYLFALSHPKPKRAYCLLHYRIILKIVSIPSRAYWPGVERMPRPVRSFVLRTIGIYHEFLKLTIFQYASFCLERLLHAAFWFSPLSKTLLALHRYKCIVNLYRYKSSTYLY